MDVQRTQDDLTPRANALVCLAPTAPTSALAARNRGEDLAASALPAWIERSDQFRIQTLSDRPAVQVARIGRQGAWLQPRQPALDGLLPADIFATFDKFARDRVKFRRITAADSRQSSTVNTP